MTMVKYCLILMAFLIGGCAGTIHYGTYAKEQSNIIAKQEASKQELYKAWQALAEHGDAQTKNMVVMGLLVQGLTNKNGRLEAPRDDIKDVLSIGLPWLGAWGIADSVGRAMQGHGGTHTNVNVQDSQGVGVGTGGGNGAGSYNWADNSNHHNQTDNSVNPPPETTPAP
jgi:hypothetical protein